MTKKIIIVGAGLSGLAACTHLMKYGFDVTILEARERIGGRVWTSNKFGVPFGCGASWIHGAEGNPMTELANYSQGKMISIDPNLFLTYDCSGGLISTQNIQQFNLKFDDILRKAKKFAYHSNNDMSLFSALRKGMKSYSLSPLELNMYEAKLISLESYHGAGRKFLSARHWDDEERWPGKNCFLISSYQPIIDDLIKGCSIKVNSVVKKISVRENDIKIATENAFYYADAVIVTIPLGVLKKNSVIFEPELPAFKRNAIENLEMGVFNIAAIEFSETFWPTETPAMFFTQFDSTSILIFFNYHYVTGLPIIVGYSGGERAQQLENFSDEGLIQITLDNLKKVFGSKIPDPKSYLITRWGSDPFSYGSYSYVPVGGSSKFREMLAKPVAEKLFFAGEATSLKYPATTHGAYLSGIREAEKIKKIFSL